jgi:hypothetical protein
MTAFSEAKSFRVFHFWLTVIYSVLNLSHAIADLLVQPVFWYQIALMVLLLFNGILLNIVTFQWMKVGLKKHLSESLP